MRLIDADKVADFVCSVCGDNCDDECRRVCLERQFTEKCAEKMPAVEAEPTEEQVKEYCRKRCLVIVTSELFNEMKARWSAEPVRHGHWIEAKYPLFTCSECGAIYQDVGYGYNYCPNCGVKIEIE